MGKKSSVKSGKRKTAIAKAFLKKGSGKILINNEDLEKYFPNKMLQLKVLEPLILQGGLKEFDFSISVRGGGQTSQSDAIRQAIARALVSKKSSLKKVFLDYDRSLLISDIRVKETNKPNNSSARAKRQKSYR